MLSLFSMHTARTGCDGAWSCVSKQVGDALDESRIEKVFALQSDELVNRLGI
jgi:hypothetical protein